ncbi:hypothetical protein [Ruegeria discodermiae]|uniref:hypothetical protein n=1 Tax=Ruegeria discodermiae TaxID=3064389 RepID=UPI003531E6DB
MLHVRGQKQGYDRWAQLGNTGGSWDDVLPFFMRSENMKTAILNFMARMGNWRSR